MRLLHTWSLELKEFSDRNAPPYAILSHTWGQEEVLLAEMMEKRASHLRGYRKISACCKQARQDGIEYVWIDTCCIDKTSSTELAEAINSMFKWYENAVVCYAYLEDITSLESFSSSRWFTRGWTLQELIAPCVVIFYDAEWNELGSRYDMLDQVEEAAGVNRIVFLGAKLSWCSVSERMSWAAKRQTTRIEDEAYCLLGLFDVSMPLLYGEGKRAFVRLQEQIMKQSDDQSIFAWRMTSRPGWGLLAPSPACFADGAFIGKGSDDDDSEPYFMTNKGIQITLPILDSDYGTPFPTLEPIPSPSSGPRIVVTPAESNTPISLRIAVLNCRTASGGKVGIFIDRHMGTEQYHRVNSDMVPFSITVEHCANFAHVQSIMAKSHDPVDYGSGRDMAKSRFFSIESLPLLGTGYAVKKIVGTLEIKRDGIISGNLLSDSRSAVVFSDGEHSFGVFYAETVGGSNWKLATGTESEILAQLEAFQAAHELLLNRLSSWRLPLGQREISMETRPRPHGFSSVLRIEEPTGKPITDPQSAGTSEEVLCRVIKGNNRPSELRDRASRGRHYKGTFHRRGARYLGPNILK